MFLAALIMGLASSLHCVTMCSPLAMAVSAAGSKAIFNRLIYNSGRITTYGLLGGIVGTAGSFFPLEKIGNLLSISLGIALVVVGVNGISRWQIPYLTTALNKVVIAVKKLFGACLQNRNRYSMLVLGGINGLLPCGMTFLALGVSLTTGSTVNGIFYMLLFGVGTLPAMLGLHSALLWLVGKFNLSFSRVSTGLIIATGMLLIARVFVIHGAHIDYHNASIVDIVICR